MNLIAELLGRTPLPSFFLLKNMQENYPGVVLFDAAELDGEVLGEFDSFEEALALVPVPKKPTEPAAVAALKERFGEDIYYDAEADEWIRGLPEIAFDTCPNHNGLMSMGHQPRDFDLFGECYTIVWVCPTDVAAVVERLLADAVRRERGELSSSPEAELLRLIDGPESSGTRRIDGYALADVWEQYIDRICFYAPEFGDLEGQAEFDARGELRKRIIDAFTEEVSKLPNGPGEEDWQRLNELLLK